MTERLENSQNPYIINNMRELLRHLFLPRETNNYRARVLHHKILLLFTIFFFSAGVLMSIVRTNFPSVLGTFSNISDQQLLDITNSDRQTAGLPPLDLNGDLTQAAVNKANDMFSKDYWAHVSPTGETPWVFIKDAGYNYVYAGENLARGYTTPQSVVAAWMASPEHRANMLSPHYKDVGFAVETGKLNGEDTVLVVEMFGSTNFATENVATKQIQQPAQVAVASSSPTTVQGTNGSSSGTLADQKTNSAPSSNLASSLPANQKTLVNGLTFSSASARVIISLFIFVLIMDMIIIERKKIVRFVGHNLDHVIFFSILFIAILILGGGAIL